MPGGRAALAGHPKSLLRDKPHRRGGDQRDTESEAGARNTQDGAATSASAVRYPRCGGRSSASWTAV